MPASETPEIETLVSVNRKDSPTLDGRRRALSFDCNNISPNNNSVSSSLSPRLLFTQRPPVTPLLTNLRFRLCFLVTIVSLIIIHLSRKRKGITFFEACRILLWDSSMVRPPVVLLFVLWGWGFVVWILTGVGVDVFKVLKCDVVSHLAYLDIWNAAAHLTALFFGSLALVSPFISYQSETVPVRDGVLALYAPLLLHLAAMALLVMPFNVLYLPQRMFLAKTLQESFLSPFYVIAFRHVLLSDILTSISKVLADMEVSMCAYTSGAESVWSKSNIEICSHSFTPLFVMSFPFVCRFVQCNRVLYDSGDRTQLFNAFKYATAIPVICFDSLSRNGLNRDYYANCWLYAVILNSVCCIFWDIFMDWGLFPAVFQLLSFNSRHRHRSKMFVVRDSMLFPSSVYVALVFIDCILRIGWTFRLLHIHPTVEGELGVFNYQIAEVVRRMLWCIVRIEYEFVKKFRANKLEGDISVLDNDSISAPIPLSLA